MTSNIEPADLIAIIPADANTSLSLPKEMIHRGLVLATKLALKPIIQNYQTPLKQCQGSYAIACVSFSKNGKFALISGYGRQGSNASLIVWNVIDGSRIIAMLLEQDGEIVYSTTLSKNAETALVGYASGNVLCWDIKNNHTTRCFSHETKDPYRHNCLIMPIQFSPEQSFTAQASSANLKRTTTDQSDRSVTSIVFSPDEQYFAECTGHLSIRIREIQSGKEIQRFPTGYLDFYHQIAFSNDGSKLIIAKGEHPTNSHGWIQTLMTLFDLTGKREPLTFGADRRIDVTAVVFFPDDQKVLSLESGGVIAVWNVLDGNEILHWSHAKSPDDANDLISREEVSTNMILETRKSIVWGMSGIAVSPDGKRILSGGGDTFMRLWSLDGHQIYEYPHKTRVVSVAFTPDGQQALSGCWDGSAYLWELPH